MESEDKEERICQNLREEIRELQKTKNDILIREEWEHWEREALYHKYYEVLRDKGIFYTRFCEELRIMKNVTRVTRYQQAANYATELRNRATRMRMQIEMDNLNQITEGENDVLAELKWENKQLKDINTKTIDRFIYDEAKAMEKAKKEKLDETHDVIPVSPGIMITRKWSTLYINLLPEQEKWDEAWELADLIKRKAEDILLLENYAEARREQLTKAKEELALCKQNLPVQSEGCIDWMKELHVFRVDYRDQLKLNTNLFQLALKVKLYYGMFALKIKSILSVPAEIQVSKNVKTAIQDAYTKYTTHNSQELQMVPLVFLVRQAWKIIPKSEESITQSLIQWLVHDTHLSPFMLSGNLKEILDNSPVPTNLLNISYTIVNTAFDNFERLICEEIQNYITIMAKIRNETRYRLGLDAYYDINPAELSENSPAHRILSRRRSIHLTVSNDPIEKLHAEKARTKKIFEERSGLRRGHSKNNTSVLFRITQRSVSMGSNSHPKLGISQETKAEKENHHDEDSSTQDIPPTPQGPQQTHDVSVKVLLNQYHQKIKGMKDNSAFNFKKLNPLISSQHLKGIRTPGEHVANKSKLPDLDATMVQSPRNIPPGRMEDHPLDCTILSIGLNASSAAHQSLPPYKHNRVNSTRNNIPSLTRIFSPVPINHHKNIPNKPPTRRSMDILPTPKDRIILQRIRNRQEYGQEGVEIRRPGGGQ